jgi:HEAT repeat protein
LALRAVPDDAVEIIMSLLGDPDPHTRARAAEAAGKNWNLRFVPLLLQLFSDNDPNVRRAAGTAIARNQDKRLYAICQKMLHENGPAAPAAFIAVAYLGPSRSELLPLLSSTNQELLNEVLPRLSPLSLDELPPLLTNSLAMARQIGLDELGRIPDNAAVDRIVSMLPDPDETVRWRVRATLRRVSGQNLGPDPAAYQKWWAENKDTFTPKLFKPASPLRFRRGGS